MRVERHFVTISGHWGTRQVHYRRCGSGPAVLLLHQSPQSSAEYAALILDWAKKFTVIAPDHPGYGLSDPLGPSDASLEDFADAIAEFLQAIHVDVTAVYGFHTGAGMAVALASRHPDKVSAVYANGYVVLSEAEREHILSEYLPPFVPQWDGSHLNWVWNRNRDQLMYFPWFDRRLEARLDYSLPPPEVFQQWLLEFLRAGDNYRVAYNAAFRFQGDQPLKDLLVPAIITAAKTDVLRDCLNKIKETANAVDVHLGGTLEVNLAEAEQFFVKHPGSEIPPPAQTEAIAGKPWNLVVPYDYGQLRVRINRSGTGRPLLLVHGLARSSANLMTLLQACSEARPVIALDLPGHGESDSWPAGVSFLDAADAAITAVLDQLNFPSVDAWGEWGGGTVLCEFARRNPRRIAHLAVTGVQYFSAEEGAELIANYAPEIKPVWHGGHLAECWHRVRNESLFWPWYQQASANIVRAKPRLNAEDLNQRVLAFLQSSADQGRLYAEIFAYPLADTLADMPVDVLLSTASWDPNLAHSLNAAAANPEYEFVTLPDDQADWAAVLLGFFAGENPDEKA